MRKIDIDGNVTVSSLKDIIVERVRRYDYVSIAELSRAIGDITEGDKVLELGKELNVLMWVNASGLFLNALIEAMDKEEIHPHITSSLIYMIDGVCIDLPVVNHIHKNGYKQPHWLPVTFRNGKSCTQKGCLTMCKSDWKV